MDTLREYGVKGEPCDAWEVRDVEQQFGVLFPAAYRAYLLVAGKGSARGVDPLCAVDALPEIREFVQCLPASRSRQLPTDAFFVNCYQGGTLHFFLLDDGDNPAVYEWTDLVDPRPIRRIALSLMHYIINGPE